RRSGAGQAGHVLGFIDIVIQAESFTCTLCCLFADSELVNASSCCELGLPGTGDFKSEASSLLLRFLFLRPGCSMQVECLDTPV
nr:hypothetical protein [Tanacetum cinerariifolium]